jgi:hypothetical protein
MIKTEIIEYFILKSAKLSIFSIADLNGMVFVYANRKV